MRATLGGGEVEELRDLGWRHECGEEHAHGGAPLLLVWLLSSEASVGTSGGSCAMAVSATRR
jgi:hypothetical protein